MKSKKSTNLLLSVCALLLAIFLVEVALHSFVKSSEKSSGVFMGIQLPPLNVLPSGISVKTDKQHAAFLNMWLKALTVNGGKITRGDSWGIFREDPLAGYVPKENTVSASGWWQSNNLGARSRENIYRERIQGRKRLLFFGDSYTQCSRVPQEETFQHYINTREPKYEAVNFGVDGYGMGQSYLRYTMVRDELEYDKVFLVFVPDVDLLRDVNVSRNIGFKWDSYKIYPRFVIDDGALKLIPSPYSSLQELVDDNRKYIKPKLDQHLKKYEPFYFDYGYQSNPFLDWSVMYKLYRAHRLKQERSKLLSSLKQPGSEAMLVTKGIVEAMKTEVENQGGEFSLVFLPIMSSIENYSLSDDFRKRWHEMVAFICAGQVDCIDLMAPFQRIPVETLDKGYDGTHYGPETNRLIAGFILDSISP
jgi:hypothetical protein